jgi:hypothetical protein
VSPRDVDRPPFDDGGNGDWTSYRRFVLAALTNIEIEQREMRNTVSELQRDMVGLKLRIAIISSITGSVIGGIVVFVGNLILAKLK